MEPELEQEQEQGAVKEQLRGQKDRGGRGVKTPSGQFLCGVPAIIRSSHDSKKQIMIWE